MGETVLAGVLAGLGIAVPIGAVGTYLVGLTARTSWRTGAAAALGIASVDGFYAVLAVTAGQLASRVVRQVQLPLRIVAVVILLALAAKSIMDGIRRFRAETVDEVQAASTRSQWRTYATFVGLTLVNPTTVIYFAALVAGGQAGLSPGLAAGLVFAAAASLASAAWQLMLVGGGALLGRAVTSRRGQLITALISALIILALAARTAVNS